MSDISAWLNAIHQGDARSTLADLPDSSVHMCMTSPPYWQLRDYGEIESIWNDSPDCTHQWECAGTVRRGGENTDANPPDVGGNRHTQSTGIRGDGIESQRCVKCDAWKGQLGLEPTVEQYVANIGEVFSELKRVLRPDGSVWLNLGDTYKNKQKQLVPHKVAIGLQNAGWVCRNDVTWVKPNPMPSSVKDRLNTTTEQIFHLTPNPDYYYDLDSIREPHAESSIARDSYAGQKNYATDRYESETPISGGANENMSNHPSGKNPGDVFEVTVKSFADAHFAVYPPELCQKPIKATCPEQVCADCGEPIDCDCTTDKTHGGIAIDPFAGAGTTCMVAKDLQRRFIGIDLNPEYVAMAQKRLGLSVTNPEYIRDASETGIESFTE